MNIQYKYIGIRGHRGSGKNTIAYLLANTIQFIHDQHIETLAELVSNELLTHNWKLWCDDIIEDERCALDNINTYNVYLDSFGYTPKFLVQLLTGIPGEFIESDYHKDHVMVQIKDFSWTIIEDEKMLNNLNNPTSDKITVETLIKMISSGYDIDDLNDDVTTLNLRDFIVYFAQVCMKYLGKNVWVKTMRCQEDRYKENEKRFKIFTDIKASSELSYILEKKGKIVMVERPENRKELKGVEQLDDDDRYDFKIHNTDIYCESFRNELLKIAFQLTYY